MQARTRTFRQRLRWPSGEGMIFVFDFPGNYPFWMQDMNFPLDMVWVERDFNIVGIVKNVSPDTYDATKSIDIETFRRTIPRTVCLRVAGRIPDKNNIQVGNKITFSKKTL